MLSCHSAPKWRGISLAKPASVPPPSAWRENASRLGHPASPRQSDAYAARSRVATVSHPVGLSAALSKHRCCGSSCEGWGRSTTTASSVAAKSLVSWTLAPATTTASGPPAASTRGLRFTQACPGRWDSARWHPPQACFAPRRIGSLPFPVHAAQGGTGGEQRRPEVFEEPQANPALEGAMGPSYHREARSATDSDFQPLRRRKMIASKAERASMRLRPVGLGGSYA